jgi:hypothetical protein
MRKKCYNIDKGNRNRKSAVATGYLNNNHPMAEQGDCYFFPLVIALINAIIKEIST